MSTEKSVNQTPDVDAMFDALVKSGVVKPDVTLKQLMEATKPLHGTQAEWGFVFDTDHYFCLWW